MDGAGRSVRRRSGGAADSDERTVRPRRAARVGAPDSREAWESDRDHSTQRTRRAGSRWWGNAMGLCGLLPPRFDQPTPWRVGSGGCVGAEAPPRAMLRA